MTKVIGRQKSSEVVVVLCADFSSIGVRERDLVRAFVLFAGHEPALFQKLLRRSTSMIALPSVRLKSSTNAAAVTTISLDVTFLVGLLI